MEWLVVVMVVVFFLGIGIVTRDAIKNASKR